MRYWPVTQKVTYLLYLKMNRQMIIGSNIVGNSQKKRNNYPCGSSLTVSVFVADAEGCVSSPAKYA